MASSKRTASGKRAPSSKRTTRSKTAASSKRVASSKRTTTKRELIDTGTNKLFVRRNARGTSFTEVTDVGRSLSADRRRRAKTIAKPGFGDRGDRRPAKKR